MPAAIPCPSREIAPPSHRLWVAQQADKFEEFEGQFHRWLSYCERADELFQKHVYGNDKVSSLDLRQHRQLLLEVMSQGEQVALNFCSLREPEKVRAYVELIDQKVEHFFRALLDWHTPPDYQDQVPDSFKQGMREAADGKLMEFPAAECAPAI